MPEEPKLIHQKCFPCEGGTKPLPLSDVAKYRQQLKNEWRIDGNKKMSFEFKFKDFVEAMKFVNKVADIANTEGHHPDLCVYYNKVNITLWTHNIGGLSVNDFILAVKVEALI